MPRIHAVSTPVICRSGGKALRFLVATAIVAHSTSAAAAIICSGPRDLAVPQDGEGIYINLVTGESGFSEGQVPGFDFDPYAQQTSTPPNQLRFYWGSASNGGAGVASSGDQYAVLAAGAEVGPDSSFTRAGAGGDTSLWQAGIAGGFLGARFQNENLGLLNYGWIRLNTSAPIGFPMAVLDWCYEDDGSAITIAPPVQNDIFCDGFDGGDGECTALPP